MLVEISNIRRIILTFQVYWQILVIMAIHCTDIIVISYWILQFDTIFTIYMILADIENLDI